MAAPRSVRTILASFAATAAPVLATQACTAPHSSEGAHAEGADADDLPRLVAEEALRIGSIDDPEVGFASVMNLEVDRDGQVYVLDAQDLGIRVYDSDGRLLRTIGRRGEGPGEFERFPGFGVHGDTVWVVDALGAQTRITLFTRAGAVLSTARANHVLVALQPPASAWGNIGPRVMRPDGFFLGDMTGTVGGSSVPAPTAELAPTDTILVPRVLFAASGAVVDTIGWTPRPPPAPPRPATEITIGSTRYRLPGAPADDPLTVRLLDGLVVVDRARATAPGEATFRVTRTDLSGDTVYTRSFRHRPLPYGTAYLDRIAWRTVQLPTGGYRLVNGMPEIPPMPPDSLAIFRTLREALEFPDFQPPVQRAWVDHDGRLWLQREDDGSDLLPWVVLEPDGRPLGVIEVPREQRILWSAGDVFWAVEEDQLGVPWVVSYRMRASGS